MVNHRVECLPYSLLLNKAGANAKRVKGPSGENKTATVASNRVYIAEVRLLALFYITHLTRIQLQHPCTQSEYSRSTAVHHYRSSRRRRHGPAQETFLGDIFRKTVTTRTSAMIPNCCTLTIVLPITRITAKLGGNPDGRCPVHPRHRTRKDREEGVACNSETGDSPAGSKYVNIEMSRKGAVS